RAQLPALIEEQQSGPVPDRSRRAEPLQSLRTIAQRILRMPSRKFLLGGSILPATSQLLIRRAEFAPAQPVRKSPAQSGYCLQVHPWRLATCLQIAATAHPQLEVGS